MHQEKKNWVIFYPLINDFYLEESKNMSAALENISNKFPDEITEVKK